MNINPYEPSQVIKRLSYDGQVKAARRCIDIWGTVLSVVAFTPLVTAAILLFFVWFPPVMLLVNACEFIAVRNRKTSRFFRDRWSWSELGCVAIWSLGVWLLFKLWLPDMVWALKHHDELLPTFVRWVARTLDWREYVH